MAMQCAVTFGSVRMQVSFLSHALVVVVAAADAILIVTVALGQQGKHLVPSGNHVTHGKCATVTYHLSNLELVQLGSFLADLPRAGATPSVRVRGVGWSAYRQRPNRGFVPSFTRSGALRQSAATVSRSRLHRDCAAILPTNPMIGSFAVGANICAKAA